ncbi:MAG: hypothetical protein KF830_07620 [Planctomycetes bacterium]|nr:hypothetical protein [Planctomycetota bacterium]
MVLALTLREPAHLGWLLLLPLLFWLALPPRPRRQRWTAHLAQWQAAHAALRRRPPRLSGLRLLLLAAAAVAAVVAGAGPAWRSAAGPDRLVVLLDASASMAARTPSGDRAFDLVTARLHAAFAALPPHVDVTLLRCGGPRLRRHGASARHLHDVGSPAGALDVDLAAIAAGVAAPATVVWALTDGQGQAALPAVGALTVVAAPGANAAVLDVRTVDRWPLPQLTVAASVVAFAAAPLEVELHARGAVGAVPPQRATLPPGEVTQLTLELERDPAGGWLDLALVAPADVLPLDDVWRAALPPLPAPRIAVLADGEAGPFAAVAAQALAAEVRGTVVTAVAGAEVGLLLVDGGVAPVVPGRVRALCFGSRLDPSVEVEPWLEPRVADWDRQSALTAGLDLSELRVAAALRGILPAGEPFLWAEAAGGRVPLAVVVDGDAAASVHFAFRLQDSNLPLLAAFPQLLRRAFVRCHGRAAQLQVATPPAAPGEQDLRQPAAGPDRPLPPFRAADVDLAAWCLVGGLLALAARAFVR